MNTRASVAYGWGVLCLAGGGAYYFAKRSINSDRAERAMAEENRRQQRERLRTVEFSSRESHLHAPTPSPHAAKPRAPNADKTNGKDPAPVQHHGDEHNNGGDPAPVTHADSKFAAKEPFRTRKGDRFS